MTIRLATRADAVRLNAALRRLSDDLGDTHRATDDMIARAGWGAHPSFRALIAEEGEAVTAVALYSPCFSTSRGGALAYISDLWVAEMQRGTGMGRRLLAEVARDAAATWGADRLKLVVYDDSPAARAFYDRLGFTPATGQTELHLDAAQCEALKGAA